MRVESGEKTFSSPSTVMCTSGDQDRARSGDFFHEFFYLRPGNAQLFQHMGEIDIRDIAQNGGKAPGVAVDFLHFQLVVGVVGRRDRIPEIKETEIDDIVLIEKILNFHGANYRPVIFSRPDPVAIGPAYP